ncbi:hypothetical protein Poly24_06450 [Rosistilla carotiformis]|uniref:Uncharacterized protein n=1 Tax=Rosistilla carotiformis TaxID=2528017 RepID=A0A518JN20_9BACT|nr:hypothetical protein [Rosistilla carotiformis]QDV66956.1 hypothetical protein Poly24_06450 [Rosistilla carotiformis]
MLGKLLLGFSFNDWWRGASRELADYYNKMDTTQWGIIASLFVVAGFLLLRTSTLKR